MSTTPPCDSDPPCTATVETLYGMGTEPANGDVLVGEEGSYPQDMGMLMGTVIAVAIILLVVHALYRLSLCCRHCFCRPGTKKGEKCCCCIETSTRGKNTALAFKVGLAVILAAVVASLLSYTAGQAMISEAVADIADSLDQLSDFLGRLQQILGDMVTSVTDMTHGVGNIACNADALTMASKEDPVPGYVSDLTDTNTTIAAMKQAIHDMKKTVDGFKDKVESGQVESAIAWGVPLLVTLPFAYYIFHTLLGILFTACRSVIPEGRVKKMSKWCAWCQLNLGAAWAGGPGLVMALVIFVALFVVSIALADFCYIGPGPVLMAAAEKANITGIGYYLECEGVNPMTAEVDAMAKAVSNLTDVSTSLAALPQCDAALQYAMTNAPAPGPYAACTLGPVCANTDTAATAITTGVNALLASVVDIKADVLNCTKFKPILKTAFYDGVCTETVAGIYYIWQVVVAAGVFTYLGIMVVPFATAAFKQEGKDFQKVGTDPEKGIFGDESAYDATGQMEQPVTDEPKEEPVL